ncbi:response regulator receiver modulated metal dependent phosphohydrolase [Geobacter metallireducens RCH3]|uniref:Response receiver-modulated cyclic diguanylate phosphodiesterase n=2 Tax=Geobacter metallireducens TaxID=28232 RepID=Q39RB0_GEOMG|nr:response regulator [Geobacter metallireducens]ABB33214.1 response receiver-modulated cyclic diguanylate phosphodiesterase [Geobacter metallireducens GS-15]EHP84427.1 response regulator receiver modulated metal dependent phosphohydrolase [Geobacter metallireducens RCH3]
MPALEQPPNIMIVDDTPANLRLLETMLQEKNYRVLLFPRADIALKAAKKNPPDLVLLDITMPGMDGFQFCASLKADSRLCSTPVIFLSGLNEPADKVKAFSLGGVDYITKPFQLEEVHARVETHLNLRRLQMEVESHNRNLESQVEAYAKEIIASQMATIFALAKLAESRDDNTGKHVERVQIYCRLLAQRLAEKGPYRGEVTPEFINNITFASPLHDIGKVAIVDRVLLKPDKLTAEEFKIMQTHTVIGAQTLATALAKYPQNEFLRTGIAIAQSHHEWWDGTGYPDGIKGREIPLHARITAVADVYDALRSNRCYRLSLPHEEVRAMILEGSGTQFDPDVVAAFIESEDEFFAISCELG